MKKLLLAILMACAFNVQSNAQEIYTEIKKMAQEVVDNPQTNPLIRQMNSFKLTALNYMGMKMREVMPDSTAEFLDKEALALYNFMTVYTQTLVENSQQPEAYQTKIIELFMDASYSNPLVNDDDRDYVLQYFVRGDCLTRFSLDTDWLRAMKAVDSELKKRQ